MNIRIPISLALILMVAAALSCSSGDGQPVTGDEAIELALARASELESYSSRFSTGFGTNTFNTSSDRMDFYSSGMVVGRGNDEALAFVNVDNAVFRYDTDGDWCFQGPEAGQIEDVMSMLPNPMDRILASEQRDEDHLIVEGIAIDYEIPTNSDQGVLVLHRLVIDLTHYDITEWTKSIVASTSGIDLLNRDDEELRELAEETKSGPWDRLGFSNFNELEPVTAPENVREECVL